MPLPPLPTRLGSRLSKEELNKAPVPDDARRPDDESATEPGAAKKATKAAKAAKATRAAKKAAKKAKTAAKKTAQKAAKKGSKTTAGKTVPATQQTAALLKHAPVKTTPAKKPAPTPAPSAAHEPIAEGEKPKIFVLDTNVLLHDANCLFMFKEHDVFIPMIVLEELDNQKKGLSEVARNARQVSRYLDGIVQGQKVDGGLALNHLGHQEALGKLFLQTQALDAKLPIDLPIGKADNAILHIVSALQRQRPVQQVILVSKDINIRLKAKALSLPAEDYRHDQVLEDSDLLYKGSREVDADF